MVRSTSLLYYVNGILLNAAFIEDNKLIRLLFIFSVFLLVNKPAYAYIGPAIVALGYLLGPVAAIFSAIAMILVWPIYRLFKKYKNKKAQPVTEDQSDINK